MSQSLIDIVATIKSSTEKYTKELNYKLLQSYFDKHEIIESEFVANDYIAELLDVISKDLQDPAAIIAQYAFEIFSKLTSGIFFPEPVSLEFQLQLQHSNNFSKCMESIFYYLDHKTDEIRTSFSLFFVSEQNIPIIMLTFLFRLLISIIKYFERSTTKPIKLYALKAFANLYGQLPSEVLSYSPLWVSKFMNIFLNNNSKSGIYIKDNNENTANDLRIQSIAIEIFHKLSQSDVYPLNAYFKDHSSELMQYLIVILQDKLCTDEAIEYCGDLWKCCIRSLHPATLIPLLRQGSTSSSSSGFLLKPLELLLLKQSLPSFPPTAPPPPSPPLPATTTTTAASARDPLASTTSPFPTSRLPIDTLTASSSSVDGSRVNSSTNSNSTGLLVGSSCWYTLIIQILQSQDWSSNGKLMKVMFTGLSYLLMKGLPPPPIPPTSNIISSINKSSNNSNSRNGDGDTDNNNNVYGHHWVGYEMSVCRRATDSLIAILLDAWPLSTCMLLKFQYSSRPSPQSLLTLLHTLLDTKALKKVSTLSTTTNGTMTNPLIPSPNIDIIKQQCFVSIKTACEILLATIPLIDKWEKVNNNKEKDDNGNIHINSKKPENGIHKDLNHKDCNDAVVAKDVEIHDDDDDNVPTAFVPPRINSWLYGMFSLTSPPKTHDIIAVDQLPDVVSVILSDLVCRCMDAVMEGSRCNLPSLDLMLSVHQSMKIWCGVIAVIGFSIVSEAAKRTSSQSQCSSKSVDDQGQTHGGHGTVSAIGHSYDNERYYASINNNYNGNYGLGGGMGMGGPHTVFTYDPEEEDGMRDMNPQVVLTSSSDMATELSKKVISIAIHLWSHFWKSPVAKKCLRERELFLESLWWLLHRLSSFDASVDDLERNQLIATLGSDKGQSNSNIHNSSLGNGKENESKHEVTYRADESPLNLVGLVFLLSLDHADHCEEEIVGQVQRNDKEEKVEVACKSIDITGRYSDTTSNNLASRHCKLLEKAISRTIRGITEAWALPALLHWLPYVTTSILTTHLSSIVTCFTTTTSTTTVGTTVSPITGKDEERLILNRIPNSLAMEPPSIKSKGKRSEPAGTTKINIFHICEPWRTVQGKVFSSSSSVIHEGTLSTMGSLSLLSVFSRNAMLNLSHMNTNLDDDQDHELAIDVKKSMIEGTRNLVCFPISLYRAGFSLSEYFSGEDVKLAWGKLLAVWLRLDFYQAVRDYLTSLFFGDMILVVSLPASSSGDTHLKDKTSRSEPWEQDRNGYHSTTAADADTFSSVNKNEIELGCWIIEQLLQVFGSMNLNKKELQESSSKHKGKVYPGLGEMFVKLCLLWSHHVRNRRSSTGNTFLWETPLASKIISIFSHLTATLLESSIYIHFNNSNSVTGSAAMVTTTSSLFTLFSNTNSMDGLMTSLVILFHTGSELLLGYRNNNNNNNNNSNTNKGSCNNNKNEYFTEIEKWNLNLLMEISYSLIYYSPALMTTLKSIFSNYIIAVCEATGPSDLVRAYCEQLWKEEIKAIEPFPGILLSSQSPAKVDKALIGSGNEDDKHKLFLSSSIGTMQAQLPIDSKSMNTISNSSNNSNNSNSHTKRKYLTVATTDKNDNVEGVGKSETALEINGNNYSKRPRQWAVPLTYTTMDRKDLGAQSQESGSQCMSQSQNQRQLSLNAQPLQPQQQQQEQQVQSDTITSNGQIKLMKEFEIEILSTDSDSLVDTNIARSDNTVGGQVGSIILPLSDPHPSNCHQAVNKLFIGPNAPQPEVDTIVNISNGSSTGGDVDDGSNHSKVQAIGIKGIGVEDSIDSYDESASSEVTVTPADIKQYMIAASSSTTSQYVEKDSQLILVLTALQNARHAFTSCEKDIMRGYRDNCLNTKALRPSLVATSTATAATMTVTDDEGVDLRNTKEISVDFKTSPSRTNIPTANLDNNPATTTVLCDLANRTTNINRKSELLPTSVIIDDCITNCYELLGALLQTRRNL